MTKDEIDVEQLKISLIRFIKNRFTACDDFIDKLNNCENEIAIVRLFKRYADDVYEELDGDLDNEIDDLEKQIRRLEREVSDLENQLGKENFNINFNDSLDDVYKIKAIRDYQGNYTSWELEELLKNGKKYLKNENTLY